MKHHQFINVICIEANQMAMTFLDRSRVHELIFPITASPGSKKICLNSTNLSVELFVEIRTCSCFSIKRDTVEEASSSILPHLELSSKPNGSDPKLASKTMSPDTILTIIRPQVSWCHSYSGGSFSNGELNLMTRLCMRDALDSLLIGGRSDSSLLFSSVSFLNSCVCCVWESTFLVM